MRSKSILMYAAAAALFTAAVVAQTPNFAGKWTMVEDPTAGGAPGGLGQTAMITQEANSLTVVRTTPMGEFKAIYKLDGSESKNTVTMQGNAIEMISKTKWDGGKLLINTTMSFDGNPVEVKVVLSLDPSGNLIVEATRPDFQGGGAPITTKSTYKKS
jgi:hypothetical protein